MNRIYLEYKDVSAWSEPLNVDAAGHLYLVLRDNEATPINPDNDKIIRGGPSSGLHVIANDPLSTTLDNYGAGESPETRASFDITDLILGGASAWDAMVDFAKGLDRVYEYELPLDVNGRNHTANSNAVILTVLNSVGVDVREIESVEGNPFFLDFPGATGEIDNLGLQGTATLLGSSHGPRSELIAASENLDEGVVLLGRKGVWNH